MTVPYGWAAGVDDECCIASPTTRHRMLCGRRRGFVPDVPPAFPPRVHDECARLWEAGGCTAEQALDAYGTCPECWGDVALVEGRIGGHGKWVQGKFGAQMSSEPCRGKGMEPATEEEP